MKPSENDLNNFNAFIIALKSLVIKAELKQKPFAVTKNARTEIRYCVN